MTTIRAVIQNGRISVPAPSDLADGTEVEVTIGIGYANKVVPMTDFKSFDFMTEDEQSDDPEMVQQWIDDLRSIPPVPAVNRKKEAEWRAWEEKMRIFNIEAVRKQFEEDARAK